MCWETDNNTELLLWHGLMVKAKQSGQKVCGDLELDTEGSSRVVEYFSLHKTH